MRGWSRWPCWASKLVLSDLRAKPLVETVSQNTFLRFCDTVFRAGRLVLIVENLQTSLALPDLPGALALMQAVAQQRGP